MKNKNLTKTLLLVLCLGLILGIGFYLFSVEQSKCDLGGGSYCQGECCKITADGCIAGPCSIILKR
jgi:hypothetical protein